MFMNEIKNTMMHHDANLCTTENGAVGYKSTLNPILDANFKIASFRHASDADIIKAFKDAYYFAPSIAITWLFYVRDVRGGLGERRFFRVCMNWLASVNTDVVIAVLKFISEYGRWDDLIYLYANTTNESVHNAIVNIIKNQLYVDTKNALRSKNTSLLAKWLPSTNATNKRNADIGMRLARELYSKHDNLTAYVLYRKKLVELRKHINIVEQKMSNNEWSNIVYDTVPSKANLLYKNAFMRHDAVRRLEYLNNLANGTSKINSSTAYPYEIVHKYAIDKYRNYSTVDATLESMWKALPNTVQDNHNTIVVADGSGSMTLTVGNTNVSALDVANSLAIYFAERCSGEFKDKYITFSERPQFVDMSCAKTLHDKINIALTHDEVANTNIKAVFDMILDTAIRCNMSQSDIPRNILIISDMEFDSCATVRTKDSWYEPVEPPTEALFDTICEQYENAGYKLPRLVFWNVNSRTNTIPVVQNDLGIALVSGFSVNTIKMVMSGELDPYKCLLEQLNTDRYKDIRKAIANLNN